MSIIHLESIKVGSHRRITRQEFQRYLSVIGAPPLADEDFEKAGMLSCAQVAQYLQTSRNFVYGLVYEQKD
jgi:hypothetical protein